MRSAPVCNRAKQIIAHVGYVLGGIWIRIYRLTVCVRRVSCVTEWHADLHNIVRMRCAYTSTGAGRFDWRWWCCCLCWFNGLRCSAVRTHTSIRRKSGTHVRSVRSSRGGGWWASEVRYINYVHTTVYLFNIHYYYFHYRNGRRGSMCCLDKHCAVRTLWNGPIIES